MSIQPTPERIIGYSTDLFGTYSNASVSLEAASVSFESGTFPTLELTYAPDSRIVQSMSPHKTFIKLVNPETYFIVISISQQVDTSGNITIIVRGYGLLSFLRNTIQPFSEFHNTSPADFFSAIIANHNKMAAPQQQMVVGTCNVTNSTDNVYRFLDDSANTLDSLNDKLVTRLGGKLVLSLDKINKQIVISYLTDPATAPTATVSLGRNLLASGIILDGTDMYNAIKPLGATQDRKSSDDSGSSDVSSPRLTIASVNNGSEILTDNTIQGNYPIMVHSQVWDDVTDPHILMQKGQQALSQSTSITETISVSALDISLIEGSQASMQVGNYVRIFNELIGLDATVKLNAVTMDLINPSNNTYTFGNLPTTILSMNKQLQKYADAQDQIKRQQQLTIIKINKAQADEEADRKALADQLAKNEDQLAKTQSDLRDATRRLNDYINSQNNGGGSGGDINGAIIDVSEFQGDINWPLVKSAGLALVIIRIQDGSDYIDKKYIQNLQGALTNDLNYAVYAFFRASSNADAATEATDFYNRVQSVVSGKKQPRFYMIDVETIEMGGNAAAMRGGVEAYMNQLNALGVPDSKILLYIANQLYTQLNLNVDRAGSIMIPSYGSIPEHPYDLHQYTSAGHIAGISTNVDMSNGASTRFISQYISA